MLADLIIHIERWMCRVAETMMQRRHGVFWSVLLCVAISITLSTPRREIWLNQYTGPEVKAFQTKVAAPLAAPHADGEQSVHLNRLTYRLTMPLFAHTLGLGIGGCKILEVLLGIFLLAMTLSVMRSMTQDDTTAFWGTVAIAAIYAGNAAFIGFRACFDSVALFFLIGAIFFRKNMLLIFACLFLAAWTDERGLIASGLVWLLLAKKFDATRQKPIWRPFAPPCLGVYLAWIAYFAARWALTREYGLAAEYTQIGFSVFLNQINNLPVGLWSALEGWWLPVFGSFAVLVWKRAYLHVFLFALGLLAVLITAFNVMDITRSASYCLPCVFCALSVLKTTEDQTSLRRLILITAVICLVWPSVHAGGRELVWWHSPPLPIQVGRWILLGR